MSTQEDKQALALTDRSEACYNYIFEKTGIEPAICEELINCMIYGTSVVSVCRNNGLVLNMIVDIRIAFDEFVETQ